jgi:hypothetical protein
MQEQPDDPARTGGRPVLAHYRSVHTCEFGLPPTYAYLCTKLYLNGDSVEGLKGTAVSYIVCPDRNV